ncbi:hypothetical protein NIES2101_30235 [Calothrix sp. HK-06]|nr:hypothetical protein NIES2101_30235 [Calothrix sp. HK-06]
MDEIDKLLAEIQNEYTQAPKSQSQSQRPNIRTLNNVVSSDKPIGLDKLLADVKADFDEKDLAVELQRQQELEAERIRVLEQQQKKRDVLKQQAQVWLSELEPLSPEGLWFESFSQGYPSQLDAAVEYLEGLEN